eukprot:c11945_g1_i1 orf=173-1417(+)
MATFSRLCRLSSRFLLPIFRPPLSRSVQTDAKDSFLGNSSSFMRAAVFWEPGRPLTIEDLQMPRPKAGEILLKTKACGLCHSDLHIIKKDQPFPTPVVLGHEVTGEVVEHGPLTDPATIKRFPVGARVVGAFIMPCGGCFYCAKGQEDLCETFFAYSRRKGTLYDGQTRLFFRNNGKPVYMYSMGGLAEYCVVPATALAVLPDSLPFAESAILGCAVFTAYGALKHAADMRAGESIAIIGIGGVGSSCLQMARAFGGCQIIAIDIDDKKLESAKKLGATHTINGTKENVPEKIRDITAGRGVDIAIEALGIPSTFVQAASAVRPGGRAVMIGLAPFEATAGINITQLVRGQIRIIGSYGARARQDLPTVVALADAGLLNINTIVSQKHNLEDVDRCFSALDKGEIIGRAVIELN